jgi:hypothetical protein
MSSDFFSSSSDRLAAASYKFRSHAFCPAVIAAYCNVEKYGCEVTDSYVLVRQAQRELVFCTSGDPRNHLAPNVKRRKRLVSTEEPGVFKSAMKEVCYDLDALFAGAPSTEISRGLKFAARDGVEIADYPEPDARLRDVYEQWKRDKEANPKTYLMAFNPARYLRTYSLSGSYSVMQKMISVRGRPYGFINFALAPPRAYEMSFLSLFCDPSMRLINDQNVCIMVYCLHELWKAGFKEVNLGPAAGIKGLKTFKHKLPHTELLVYSGRA